MSSLSASRLSKTPIHVSHIHACRPQLARGTRITSSSRRGIINSANHKPHSDPIDQPVVGRRCWVRSVGTDTAETSAAHVCAIHQLSFGIYIFLSDGICAVCAPELVETELARPGRHISCRRSNDAIPHRSGSLVEQSKLVCKHFWGSPRKPRAPWVHTPPKNVRMIRAHTY